MAESRKYLQDLHGRATSRDAQVRNVTSIWICRDSQRSSTIASVRFRSIRILSKVASLIYKRKQNVLREARETYFMCRNSTRDASDGSCVARLVERHASLIVPNRPDERSATHGPKHGPLRAKAAKRRDRSNLVAESKQETKRSKRNNYETTIEQLTLNKDESNI